MSIFARTNNPIIIVFEHRVSIHTQYVCLKYFIVLIFAVSRREAECLVVCEDLDKGVQDVQDMGNPQVRSPI